MSKLTIRDFGPIPACELEIQDFMILIGKQATGKSTICKAIYYFKTIRDELKTYLHQILSQGKNETDNFPSCMEEILIRRFEDFFGVGKLKGSYLKYEYDKGVSIEIKSVSERKDYPAIFFSDKLLIEIQKIENLAHANYLELSKLDGTKADHFYLLEKQKSFKIIDLMANKTFFDDRENHYIPAGRGLLSLLSEQFINIDLKNLDLVTSDFIKLIQEERKFFSNPLTLEIEKSSMSGMERIREKMAPVSSHIKAILAGEYLFKEGKEFLRVRNNGLLPINYASSGQQEILWILNILYVWIRNNRNAFVVIEEPEAHLYPSAQKELIDFIAYFFNSNNNKVIISTHSPYVLTAANNLLYAAKIGSLDPVGVEKIVPQTNWLPADRFSAYMVGAEKTDYVQSIVDESINEIMAEKIDDISSGINQEYAKLFALEVKHGKKKQ